MIKGMDNSLGLAGGFAFMHKVERTEEDLAALSPRAESAPAAQPASSSSLMSRNFFNSDRQQSKYVASSLETKRQEAVQAQRMTSVVAALIAQAAVWNMEREFGGEDKIDNTYVIGNRLGATSARVVGQAAKEDTLEEARENLDELKEDLKARAAPKDENGEPAQGLAGDLGGADAPAVPAAQATVPDAAPAAAPQAPSINITV